MNQLYFIGFHVTIVLFTFLNGLTKKDHDYKIRELTDLKNHKNKEVVIFVYHRFGNSTYPATNISLENFKMHLSYLKNNNFKVLTFGEAVDYIKKLEIEYTDKVACITIDDGYATFKSNAMPLLNEFGFKATLFINSETVGAGSYMDWSELREVYEQGIEIGNHSHSHAYFLNKPKEHRIEFFTKDVQKCQEEINKHLGFYPEIFAYPYGEFDLKMKERLKDLGFKAAAAQNSGVMYFRDIYSIPRFPMAGPYAKIEDFVEKANMKALRIKSIQPESFLINENNPPKITVLFNSSEADLTRHSCFTSEECLTTLHGNLMTIQAKKEILGRRTLYTITAPSTKGKDWYWFSHLWINPEIR